MSGSTVAKHSDELRFPELLEAVEAVAPTGRPFLAVIVPLDREADLIHEAARVCLYPKRRCVVRYVPHRPAKRILLELDRLQWFGTRSGDSPWKPRGLSIIRRNTVRSSAI
jgi:tRNA1(Val) A37 N6-methylase TrmN6